LIDEQGGTGFLIQKAITGLGTAGSLLLGRRSGPMVSVFAAWQMFYGANSASARDPFGHVWVLLTWKEDLEPAEMERRGKAFFQQ
jgi:hypothetical protein